MLQLPLMSKIFFSVLDYKRGLKNLIHTNCGGNQSLPSKDIILVAIHPLTGDIKPANNKQFSRLLGENVTDTGAN